MSALNLNKVVLAGRITADPELKQTPTGVSVLRFTLAVNRRFSKSNEQGEQQTDFINLVAWRQRAEFICKYFKKGSMIAIEGEIQTRNFEDKNGNKRKAVEVLVNHVSFCGSKSDSGSRNNVNIDPENDPLNKVQDKLNEFADLGNVEDDDLPF